MQPLMLDQTPDGWIPFQNRGDPGRIGLDVGRKTAGFMHEVDAVMDRLEGQADPEVAGIALQHPHAAHNVVQDLVSRTVALRVDSGGVVVEIDPVGHDNRCRQDEREDGIVGVEGGVVVMKENPAAQPEVKGAASRGGDEGGMVCESPLGADLGDIGGARAKGGIDFFVGDPGETERRRPFAASGGPGLGERGAEDDEVGVVGRRHTLKIEENDVIGRGGV